MGQEITSSDSSLGNVEFRFSGMSPGEGDNSYAKNSQLQAKAVNVILPRFFEAIKSMNLTDSDQVFRIADLGCSSGPNTISAMEAVIDQVRARYREAEAGDSGPEIQVYFQDLPATDFNTLIKLLFSQPRSDEDKVRNYMSAAVPGSFYDRLFPKSTINIAISTFGLHWISEVPAAVRDRASPAYNGGHTHIYRSSLATIEAYAEQATKDLDNFLAARAHEIAPGGLLFLAFMIRPRGDEPYRTSLWQHGVEDVWDSLVLEGAVSEELRDGYNTPTYSRSLDEVNTQLESYSSVFETQKREVITYTIENFLSSYPDTREAARVRVTANRGTSTLALEAYIGESATRLYFQKLEDAFNEIFTREKITRERDGTESPVMTSILVLSLRRK
ncbi:hypothetical protein Mapa_002607 [Marchantia paleacea]|nr:hypothetical protein Mapa_002607 [Marchantia paleacea]